MTKIVRLTAENVKRLRAVEITPDPTVQIIGGNNGQGKTSVLDAILYTLGGGGAQRGTPRPIRDGADQANVTLDLGDLIVSRIWTGDGPGVLRVTTAEGLPYRSPQSVLDTLLGKVSFDPLAFVNLSARDQRDQLLGLVDLPFDPAALDQERALLFDARTEAGRSVRFYEAQVAGAAAKVGDPATVGDRVDVSALLAEGERIRAANTECRELARQWYDVRRNNELIVAEIGRLEEELKDAKHRLDFGKDALATLDQHMADAGPEESLDDITGRIANADAINARVNLRDAWQHEADELRAAKATRDDLTAQIEAIDARKAEGLAAATFPVPGLGFDADGVTYQGVPFSQASSAEQIRVSLGMAMALNPSLRVVRILDGSLLDADALAAIRDMAIAADFQVWIERVGDADAGAVIIEDGQVRA